MEQKPALRNNRSHCFTFFLLLFACSVLRVSAATWYVDGTASGKNNGTSWADAWTSLMSMRGLAPGDTVYISGGPTGSSQAYSLGGTWGQFTDLSGYTNGTNGLPITYQIGQDAAHNGIAIFNNITGGNALLYSPSNIIFSGDAGDGQMHFLASNYDVVFNFAGSSNVTLSYLNAGNSVYFGDANGANGIHIDHCYALVAGAGTDHCTYAQFRGSAYGDNTCDHCTFYVPHDSTSAAEGSDCFQWVGSGYTISNNLVVGYDLAGAHGNHQDGDQMTGGDSTILIYGNTFVNIGNYAVYGDCYYGGLSDVHVYNNTILVSEAAVNTGSPGGIIFGVDGGYPGPGAPNFTCPFDNVTIINNTIVDMNTADGAAGIALNAENGNGTFTNCIIANNAMVNSGTAFDLRGDTASTVTNNVFLTTAQASASFVSYTPYGGLSNNLHLVAGATLLIGQGIDESSYFLTDKDLSLRTTASNWDVGAYEFAQDGSSIPLAPVITSSLNANTILNGLSSIFYTITASNSPTNFNATGLPPGLILDPSTGVISGTPTSKSGMYSVTISAANGAGSASANLQIIVNPGTTTVSSSTAPSAGSSTLAPVITSATSIVAIMDSPLSPPYTITASNTPTSFDATGLPQGLILDSVTGIISGIPNTKAGTYSITISATNSAGSGSATLILAVNQVAATTNLTPTISATNISNQGLLSDAAPATRLTNFSARGFSGTGPNLLTVGFVVAGGGKSILVRGIGPSLAAFGFSGALEDPQLSLFSDATLFQSNDGWNGATVLINAFAQVGAFALSANSNDSALLATLSSGSYTAQIASTSGSSGIALAEIYDADTAPTPVGQLVNLSARADVGIGSNVLVAGFTISGTEQETVLILGIGPTLSQFGIAGVLANPQLTLFDANGNQLNTNAGWGGTDALANTFAQVGAFSLASNSNDAALLVTLSPGTYSAQINGVNGTTGIALLEVYEVL